MKRTHVIIGISAVAFIVIASGVVLFFLMQSKQEKVADKPAESVCIEQSPVGYTPTPPVEVDPQYNNKEYGFTLYLPEYWRGKYNVTEKKNVVFFRHLQSALLHPENDEYGTLFKAYLFDSKEEWQKANETLPNVLVSYILTDDAPIETEIYVIFQIPMDTPVGIDDGEAAIAEYFNLLDKTDWLLANNEGRCFSGAIKEKVLTNKVVKFPEFVPVVKGGHIEVTNDAILYTSPNGNAFKIADYPSFSDLGEGVMSVRYHYGFNIYMGICHPFYAQILFDKSGSVIADPKYNFIEPFVEGMARCCIGVAVDDSLDGKYGFINTKGEEVIPPKYNQVTSFSEGLAVVNTYKNNRSYYGFIDSTGKEVVPLIYEHAYSFSEGLASVKVNEYYGFIDKTGHMVIAPIFFTVGGRFSEGLAPVIDSAGKFGYIDKTGKVIIDYQYSYALNFHDGYALVSEPGVESMYGYDSGRYYGNWGIIDTKGNKIKPYTYQSLKLLQNSLAIVGKDDLHGVIDLAGNIIIPLQYYDVYPTAEDLTAFDFIVRNKDSTIWSGFVFGLFSINGEELFPVEYENIVSYPSSDKITVMGYKDGEETVMRTYKK